MEEQEINRLRKVIGRNTIGDLLRRAARRSPDKLAVSFYDTKLTYRQWNDAVNALAHGLHDKGVKCGDHVALIGRNSLDYLSGFLALAKLGAVSVPINPALKEQEMAYILSYGDVRHAFFDAQLETIVTKASEIAGISLEVRLKLNEKGERSLSGAASTDTSEFWSDIDETTPVQILYTSGTEARPKGAVHTHRSLIDQYASIIIAGQFSEHDVTLHALPLYHSAQLNAFFGPMLYLSAGHVVVDRPDPAILIEEISKNEVTLFFAPPTVWIGILRSPEFSPERLKCLKKAVYGASIMPEEILKELNRLLPWVKFYNMYGMTEVAPFATSLPPEQQLIRPRSVGKPGVNVEMTILRDDDSEADVGEIGEIAFRTSHAMREYYKAPELTLQAFRNGWYHTGDIGFIDEEGYLTIVDRKKDMIKTGGENVASREVEEVIYLHPAVQECAVVGMPHPKWIEAVVAAVVVRQGQNVKEQEIIDHCKKHLAGFKVPKAVVFVDSLPKSASGKILKKDIRENLASQGFYFD